ncbi:expressed unknown protein [Seminavis robusta]|uniref:Uncharacterized protein n=1 Tax=Seminavis robusta TaxID=568900 RepID=A0A9N8DSU5_9STRA|nr:expressed unknown protein [Seminavis robusta]|eukprot:Sro328_g118600.1 n/a (279) ;mRNA; r:26570-27406
MDGGKKTSKDEAIQDHGQTKARTSFLSLSKGEAEWFNIFNRILSCMTALFGDLGPPSHGIQHHSNSTDSRNRSHKSKEQSSKNRVAAATMSSLSEIFLMHLKATTSEISIVPDNAMSSSMMSMSSSINSLSHSFRSSDGQSITWSRTRPTRRSSSRWESDESSVDDRPDIPTRQVSSTALVSDDEDDDVVLCHVRRRHQHDDSQICDACEEQSLKDSEPKKPLRQTSSNDLMLALPRIPRRQNSFRGNSRRERRRKPRGVRREKTFPRESVNAGAVAA